MKKMIRKMNKRGGHEVSILIFVMLTVALVTSAFLAFNSGFGVLDLSLQGNTAVVNAIAEKNEVDFYFDNLVEKVFLETYVEFLSNGEYTEKGNFNGEVYLGELNPFFEEEFEKAFSDKVINVHYPGKGAFFEVKRKIDAGDFSVDFNDGNLVFDFVSSLETISRESTTYVQYSFDVSENVGLEELGLDSFEEIYDVKEKCLEEKELFDAGEDSDVSFEEDFKKCFDENLKGFKVLSCDFSSGKIEFESKKSYFIRGEFRKIIFSFIVQ